ncbi:MAG: UDP-3-O-(3-hydroxymyristoyl)glucosamine N-acyltransferase [Saprospiraceae bacterium]|nr:UDP-3-O-(3-hydroxymyristoyl)glucosamine N-acyltransferase [Saprospiraceae bacterium]
MKFDQPIPIQKIAHRFKAEIIGDATLSALGINEIHNVRAGDITFSDVRKYFDKALQSEATFIILNENPDAIPDGKVVLLHPQPFEVYNGIVRELRPFNPLSQEVADSANIHPSVVIEPNVVIGNHVRIGQGSYIQANAVIHDFTIIGKNVQIGAGALIGTDAFYFKRNTVQGTPFVRMDSFGGEVYKKWRSGGRVIIEDNVDIGSGCSINKGVSSDTTIGAGTKIDCQVHIGHDAQIGKNCLIAAQAGISGNTIVEDEVIIYGQVGIAQNLRIGKKAIILAKSGVSKDLEGGKTYFGYPAQEVRDAYKELAILRQLRKK